MKRTGWSSHAATERSLANATKEPLKTADRMARMMPGSAIAEVLACARQVIKEATLQLLSGEAAK